MQDELHQLFKELEKITGIGDIGYHQIKDGKLNPVYKTNTQGLSVEKWKKEHAKNTVFVKDTPILQEIIAECKTVFITDTKNDSRSANEFFLFGIDSILIIPVIKDKTVAGIMVVASIGKMRELTEEQIFMCKELVRKYTDKL
ncbi:MAG: GAF domain-containing protein [Bacillota bacterium]